MKPNTEFFRDIPLQVLSTAVAENANMTETVREVTPTSSVAKIVFAERRALESTTDQPRPLLKGILREPNAPSTHHVKFPARNLKVECGASASYTSKHMGRLYTFSEPKLLSSAELGPTAFSPLKAGRDDTIIHEKPLQDNSAKLLKDSMLQSFIALRTIITQVDSRFTRKLRATVDECGKFRFELLDTQTYLGLRAPKLFQGKSPEAKETCRLISKFLNECTRHRLSDIAQATMDELEPGLRRYLTKTLERDREALRQFDRAISGFRSIRKPSEIEPSKCEKWLKEQNVFEDFIASEYTDLIKRGSGSAVWGEEASLCKVMADERVDEGAALLRFDSESSVKGQILQKNGPGSAIFYQVKKLPDGTLEVKVPREQLHKTDSKRLAVAAGLSIYYNVKEFPEVPFAILIPCMQTQKGIASGNYWQSSKVYTREQMPHLLVYITHKMQLKAKLQDMHGNRYALDHVMLPTSEGLEDIFGTAPSAAFHPHFMSI